MSIYDTLNPMQKEAVLHTEGPLLILAGAGSGKTRVLTHRIAYLIEKKGVRPQHILAITFTNKAAQEMRTRVDDLLQYQAGRVWVSTFHSACVRILRKDIDRLGYENHFAIYDTEDQRAVVKEICRSKHVDVKRISEREILSAISHAKNEMISVEEMEKDAWDYGEKMTAMVYRSYQAALKKNNALDFDDLLLKTVELFEKFEDVLEYYQDKFRYIMVDEYQDTNLVQFRLVSMLAAKYGNLCVVGDDDQSIYRFRGADIQNILGFERVYPDAKVIRLEQNYRSTKTILNAANQVIANNEERKSKTLWTENEGGSKIHFRQFPNGFLEAEYIAEEIQKACEDGLCTYKDCAVLYRTNAQSRLLEEKFIWSNIPYKIVGGVNFYARKEVKDLLCYLKTIDNARDDVAVQRIINVPRRGIGATTMGRIGEYAQQENLSFYEALKEAQRVPSIGRAVKKIESFVSMIQMLKTKAEAYTVAELLKEILELTGYVQELEKEGAAEAKDRMENIDELISKAVTYQELMKEQNQPASLSGFLEEVALVADIDTVDPDQDYVLLMTLHSAKGLEFPRVFMAGMEENLFPTYQVVHYGNDEDIEEERRLCYVGITRAMQELTLTCARERMIRGEIQNNPVSRFVQEIPRELVDLGYTVRPNKARVEQMRAADDKYAQMKQLFQKNTYKPVEVKVTKTDSLDYTVGDTVRHSKFGEGVVKSIVEGGRDYEVTVEFASYGERKMFAGFAKLKKV